MRPPGTALLLSLLLFALATETAGAQGTGDGVDRERTPIHRRELWMLGISLGAGPGHLHNDLNDQTMQEWGGVVQLRGGGKIHPKLLLHLELESWLRDRLVGSSSYRVDMFQYALGLTWYPFDEHSRSGAWWFRGALGLANVRVEPEGGFSGDAYSEGGWSWILAAGYEFRVARTVALGLGLSYDGLDIDGNVFREGRFFALTADLNWYPQ